MSLSQRSLLPDDPAIAPDVADRPTIRWLDAALDAAIVRGDHAGRLFEAYGPPDLLPADAATLIGHRVSDVDALPATVRDAWTAAFERCVDTQRPQIVAYQLDRGPGPRSFEARMMPTDGAVVVAIRDVGERDRLRQRLEHLATHDVLTGLGNARALRERLGEWMRADAAVALLVVDLDRFKQANDLGGRAIGDSLLRLVAQRLQREAAASGDDHVVVRLGGDQFAVALPVDGPAGAMALADRCLAVLAASTRIAGRTLFVRGSIGIAVSPSDGCDPATLLSQAEGALARAKQAGRNQARRHGDDRPSGPPPIDEAALRAALAADRFVVHYQPKFTRASAWSTPVAVEALVRWRTPDGGLLLPQDFIPLAESSGVVRPLGDRILRTALADVARAVAGGAPRVGVSVNVSLLQLHDRAFIETVAHALRDHGFAPHELTLEFAETAFVDDVRLVADTAAELSASGVRLAIDHFGAGTAGLVALKSLPIDEIRIDRGFVDGAAIDAFDGSIVAGLADLAHRLGKTVTADGVERVEQLDALGRMGCDAAQGNGLGTPRPASELGTVAAAR